MGYEETPFLAVQHEKKALKIIIVCDVSIGNCSE